MEIAVWAQEIALCGWTLLSGHGICRLGMEFAVWAWKLLSGHGICCLGMEIAVWAQEIALWPGAKPVNYVEVCVCKCAFDYCLAFL
jgi:hypothetical protein